MDERTEKAIETALTHELMLNEREVIHPTYGPVILHRPTPQMEYQIGELRRKQYHKDLQDETILSRAELEKLAIRRGIWSKEDAQRSVTLQARIGQIMGLLDTVGYQTLDQVLDKYNTTVMKLIDSYKDHSKEEEVVNAIRRYFDLTVAEQKNEDYLIIHQNATSSVVDDLLNEARLYMTQIKLLEEKALAQKELEPLLIEQARLFKDSIEARADRTEVLAKLFYCLETPDKKRLWKSYDEMLTSKPRDLELLTEEMYYFERGIPEKDRNILARHGFTMRAPTDDSSDDSQGSPLSNSNGESQPNEPISSGATSE